MRIDEFKRAYLRLAEALANGSQDSEICHTLCELAHSELAEEEHEDQKIVAAKVYEIYFSRLRYAVGTENVARRLFPNLSPAVDQRWISFPQCMNMLLEALLDFPLHLRVIFAYNFLEEAGRRNVIAARLLDAAIDELSDVAGAARNGKDLDSLYDDVVKLLLGKILPIDQNKEWFVKVVNHDRGVADRIDTWVFLSEYALSPRGKRFSRDKNEKKDSAAQIRDKWNDHKGKIALKLPRQCFLERK